MARKLIIGIFISICLIFVMSHNAKAITPVIELNNYSLVRSGNFSTNCEFSGTFEVASTGACTITPRGNVNLNIIKTNNDIASKSGDLIHFYLFIYTNQDNLQYEPKLLLHTYSTQNYSIIQYDEISYSKYNEQLISYGGYINWSPNNDFSIDYETFNSYYKIYEITLRSDLDGSRPFGLYGPGLFSLTFNQIPGATLTFALRSFTQWRKVESQENKEVEEKTQSAVDESAASGESSQGSVEGSTQNLMSAGASIISALSNAPATDCNINMSTSGSSSAFTGAIGSVNLCSGVPSGVLTMVQGIVALVFTPIVLYYTYSIITTIYKQFREYNS